jgi:rhodanese-related sulfurtransferase/DNA-binding transcriptional ArsR family regulator
MGSRDAKNELFDALASVAKVLGNGRRAEIVDVLAQGERSVEELSSEIGQTVANTSQHLQHLLRAGLVDTRRDGTRIYYSLSSPSVSRLWGTIRQVAEEHIGHLEELATSYLGDRSTLTTMTRTELTDRLDAGDVVIIDVRADVECRAGHIAGATSIPVKELEERLDGLPESRLVVAYCRGPYCVYADDAVRALHQRGIQAARLEEGYPEWQDAGLPVETN